MLEFDQAGNLLRHWGGPGEGFEWPLSNHGITIDYKGNVWIGGNSRDPVPGRTPVPGAFESYHDDMVLKFTRDGKFLLQIGKPGRSTGSNDTENLRLPAKTFVDPKTNELYVADGYANHRVIVFDADTGRYKRHWGAYGKRPDDAIADAYKADAPPAQQFRNPVHCAMLADDGLLYVCDRGNDRIQVFKPDGTFVKEKLIEPGTPSAPASPGTSRFRGATRDQKYIYVCDAAKTIASISSTVNRWRCLPALAKAATPARRILRRAQHRATDSKGNIYTTGSVARPACPAVPV